MDPHNKPSGKPLDKFNFSDKQAKNAKLDSEPSRIIRRKTSSSILGYSGLSADQQLKLDVI